MGQKETDIADLVGAYPVCKDCGSRDVVRDAWTRWNFALGEWELKSVFNHSACDACGSEASFAWKLDEAFRKKRIRRLNDALRRGDGDNATIVITTGLKDRGSDFLHEASRAVANFSQFSEDNDPHLEHDFGAIEIQGENLFWKIDYFDLTLSIASPDPADPSVTHRVMTIMLVREY